MFEIIYRAVALGAALLLSGQVCGDAPHARPAPDAPALAALGPHAVGVMRQSLPREQIGARVPAPYAAKRIAALIWYPAQSSATDRPSTAYRARLPVSLRVEPHGGAPVMVAGIAIDDAPPESGGPWPLVIISHGFQNWAANMAYLGENLASKGYVVASIDHFDLDVTDAESRRISAAETVLTRAADIAAVAEWIIDRGADPADPLHGRIDPDRIALAGYSMGGFGALTAAGAAVDPASPMIAALPEALKPPASQYLSGRVGALLLIAPWGGAPDVRIWTAESLATLNVPALLIAGSHDDIVDYAGGVRWLFDTMRAADRSLLVYENARHNTGPEPAPPEIRHAMASLERYEEPVWRAERIMAINQHFATAYLDAALKQDARAARYLDLPVVRSNDGVWAKSRRRQLSGASRPPFDALATRQDNPDFWPGFQPRWALGLQYHTASGRRQKADQAEAVQTN